MSSRDTTGNMGASTEAHITGSDETGVFITDEPPTSSTPATGSSNVGINTTGANRPNFTPGDARADAPADAPADETVLTHVSVGMTVVDAAGEEAGTVSAVQPPGTGIRPDAPVGIAEELESVGYIRVDGAGHLANDTYAAADQIARAGEGQADVVTLLIRREELIRAS
jgi:hypothetical protein